MKENYILTLYFCTRSLNNATISKQSLHSVILMSIRRITIFISEIKEKHGGRERRSVYDEPIDWLDRFFSVSGTRFRQFHRNSRSVFLPSGEGKISVIEGTELTRGGARAGRRRDERRRETTGEGDGQGKEKRDKEASKMRDDEE